MLRLIKDFFEELEQNEIKYVHWKSNARLHEFVNGDSDLDILFYSEDREAAEDILFRLGARKFEALPIGKYPNIEDYLAIDRATGRLIHFHIHFQLDIGESNVKRYPLPWVEMILENRVKHESVPVWIPRHEHELLLLIIRESLRIHPLKLLFKNRHQIEKKSFSEFRWLRKRIKREDFEKTVSTFFKSEKRVENLLLNIFENGLTETSVQDLWFELASLRKEYRTSGDIATVFFLLRNRISKMSISWFRRLGYFSPQQRIHSKDGLIIAITGSDGSGKTTTIENLEKIYGRKLDVEKLYLGMPKPQKSKYPNLVKLIYLLRLKKIWNVYVKYIRVNKAIRLRKKRILVLCDRFPQSQYPGVMDGPLASNWTDSKNPFKKWFARFEKSLFQSMQKTRADLIIKLQVDSQTSHRRGGLPVKVAEKKTKIVEETVFPNAANIVTIDTVKNSADEVRSKVTNEIWEVYKKKHETN